MVQVVARRGVKMRELLLDGLLLTRESSLLFLERRQLSCTRHLGASAQHAVSTRALARGHPAERTPSRAGAASSLPRRLSVEF